MMMKIIMILIESDELLIQAKAHQIECVIELFKQIINGDFYGIKNDGEITDEDIERVRIYALNSIKRIPLYSNNIEPEIMSDLDTFIMDLFGQNILITWPSIVEFLLYLAMIWDEAYPTGFSIFPSLINQVLSQIPQEDFNTIFYTLLLSKSVFKSVKKLAQSKDEYDESLSNA